MFRTILAASTLILSASAHVALFYPAQFNAPWNPKAEQSKIDYSNTSPLSGAAQFPCKQAHVGMTDKDSVATWDAGGSYNFTTKGSAVHGGGSCQASLSFDGGKKFTVIHSYQGNCPTVDGSFNFKIPGDSPTGLAIFSWSWIPKMSGGPEFYQGCAAITIDAVKVASIKASVPFAERPDLFVANLGSGASFVGQDVAYPSPGPSEDVTGGSASAPGNGAGSPPASASPIPAPSASSSAVEQPSQTSTPAASSTGAAPISTGTGGAIPISSTIGACGPQIGKCSVAGAYCSSAGYCGFSDEYKTNAQTEYSNVARRDSAPFPIISSNAPIGRNFPRGVAGRVQG